MHLYGAAGYDGGGQDHHHPQMGKELHTVIEDKVLPGLQQSAGAGQLRACRTVGIGPPNSP